MGVTEKRFLRILGIVMGGLFLSGLITLISSGLTPPTPTPQTVIKEVPQEIQKNDNVDYSTIVAEWQNRVAMVTCYWGSSNEQSLTSVGGSALLTTIANYGFVAVTNKHVVTDSYGRTADSCMLLLAGFGDISSMATNSLKFLYGDPFLVDQNGRDTAYIKLDHLGFVRDKNGLFAAAAKVTLNLCSVSRVRIGDELVVLGYPTIGSQNGITATKGIISGIENDYYVTDAKIDRGNSGGAAILIKDNCYIGIPTWASAGSIESLGRILKTDF